MAGANVGRTFAFIGTSVAIFTFVLSLFYPRYVSGEINGFLFQVVLTVIGLAIFSFVIAAVTYYLIQVPQSLDSKELARLIRRAEIFFLIGFSSLLAEPTLILFTVGLDLVALVFLAMWIGYFYYILHERGVTLSRPPHHD